ncbi:Ubiquitin-conjugating enzyme-like protein [Balamuthia mandrillaris]
MTLAVSASATTTTTTTAVAATVVASKEEEERLLHRHRFNKGGGSLLTSCSRAKEEAVEPVASAATQPTVPTTTLDFKKRTEKRKRNAAFLASHYTPAMQFVDLMGTFLYAVLALHLCYNLIFFSIFSSFNNFMTFVAMVPLAALISDFGSGLLHWGSDTWGSLDTPLFGTSLIRSFREHHVDPMAITRHSFAETNGIALLAAVPVLLFFSLVEGPLSNPSGQLLDLRFSFLSLVAAGSFLLPFTNQFHKWAHTHRPPWLVRQLQNYHLILRPQCHQRHHFSPYDRDYCITTGWLNPFLQAIGFWQRLEALVSWLTGAKPREDDYLWTRLTTHTDSQDHKYATSLAALSHSSPSSPQEGAKTI